MSEMMWMRMPGQTWPGVAASFVGMWFVMTAAMMLPSLIPMLRRYRQSVGDTGRTRLAWLTTIVGVAYLFVWTVIGVVVFPMAVALSSITTRLPIVVGAAVSMAGLLQLTRWKAHRLASCEKPPEGTCSSATVAWRHGLHLGVDCTQCCASLMVIPLIPGLMDLRVMAAVTVAITAERLAPAGVRVARATGIVIVASGLTLIVRAAAH